MFKKSFDTPLDYLHRKAGKKISRKSKSVHFMLLCVFIIVVFMSLFDVSVFLFYMDFN